MYRLRLAALAVPALGLSLVCGCLSLPCHPLLGGRHAAVPETDCCDIGAVPDVGLPGGGGCCQAPPISGNLPMLPPPNLAPQTTPPLTNPPGADRLVPVPNAAPRMPYNPQQ